MRTLLFTSNWEKYFATVDENLSQIKVDLGALEFKEGFNHSFFIRLDYQFESQFPNGEEEKEISQILEYFEAALVASKLNAKFVGSVSSERVIDFVFVAKDIFELKPILDKILKEYSFQSSWLKDDQWTIYERLLSPSEEDLIYIYNRKLLQDYFSSHQDEEHDVYQYQIFHDKHDAQAFLSKVHQKFTILETILTKDQMYIVQLMRKQTMSFIELNQVSLELHTLAKRHNGHYVSCHYDDVNKENDDAQHS